MEYLLHHLLTNSVARFPDKDAVRMDGHGLSYQELGRLTDQIACTLQDLGVQRGDRVGLYVHKSFASVIGVFGIMKAGAAYVPLDPNAPAKRLAYITRDCGITVVLTSPAKLGTLAEFFVEGSTIKNVILMEDAAEEVSTLPEDIHVTPWSVVKEEDSDAHVNIETIDTDLAYILYTSGSTGAPKGVMISHRTIFTFVNWSYDHFGMTADDRVTSHAPLHFDLSTFDLYATIKAGATIVLVGETLSTLPAKLSALLENEQITITYLVPSILSMMVRFGKLDNYNLQELRMVLFAGEVFPIKYLGRLVSLLPNAEFYNLYGPTETNVCTYYQVQPADVATDRVESVPIGRSCGNLEVFACTEDGQLVTEPGQEGELWVRGSCVAQGYWGDAEKTAKSFVQAPNLLYADPAYRTGDIVSLAPDRTNWSFVGRRDHMIKSRGYRIELGEIESALYRHEQVKEAAVVAIPDDLLGNRLRAFVVSTEGQNLTAKELIVFCASQVPKYMVPEHIELCDTIPKTTTGKIDRKALVRKT